MKYSHEKHKTIQQRIVESLRRQPTTKEKESISIRMSHEIISSDWQSFHNKNTDLAVYRQQWPDNICAFFSENIVKDIISVPSLVLPSVQLDLLYWSLTCHQPVFISNDISVGKYDKDVHKAYLVFFHEEDKQRFNEEFVPTIFARESILGLLQTDMLRLSISKNASQAVELQSPIAFEMNGTFFRVDTQNAAEEAHRLYSMFDGIISKPQTIQPLQLFLYKAIREHCEQWPIIEPRKHIVPTFKRDKISLTTYLKAVSDSESEVLKRKNGFQNINLPVFSTLAFHAIIKNVMNLFDSYDLGDQAAHSHSSICIDKPDLTDSDFLSDFTSGDSARALVSTPVASMKIPKFDFEPVLPDWVKEVDHNNAHLLHPSVNIMDEFDKYVTPDEEIFI